MVEKFTNRDFELDAMPISDLIFALMTIKSMDKDAVVSIRQCRGTDFPPFMAVESKAEYERANEEGKFPVC